MLRNLGPNIVKNQLKKVTPKRFKFYPKSTTGPSCHFQHIGLGPLGITRRGSIYHSRRQISPLWSISHLCPLLSFTGPKNICRVHWAFGVEPAARIEPLVGICVPKIVKRGVREKLLGKKI